MCVQCLTQANEGSTKVCVSGVTRGERAAQSRNSPPPGRRPCRQAHDGAQEAEGVPGGAVPPHPHSVWVHTMGSSEEKNQVLFKLKKRSLSVVIEVCHVVGSVGHTVFAPSITHTPGYTIQIQSACTSSSSPQPLGSSRQGPPSPACVSSPACIGRDVAGIYYECSLSTRHHVYTVERPLVS